MGAVTDFLLRLVQENLDEHGVVIWYDPEKQYSSVVEKLKQNVPVLFYEGSFFKLRYQLEDYLAGMEREKVLVYVPEKHNEIASPLIEAESCGTFMKPGGPTGRNTRLEILTRNALAGIFDAENIAGFEKRIQEGSLTLEDLDKLSDKGEEIGKAGAVSLIFDTAVPAEVALLFLSNEDYDQKIEEKNALKEIEALIYSYFGFETDAIGLKDFREKLTRYILISDFIGRLPEDVHIPALDMVPKAQRKVHVEACKRLVITWQSRRDMKDSYINAAEKIERDFDLASIKVPPEKLASVETFPCIEKALITHAINQVLKGKFSEALEMTKSRMSTFWPEVGYSNSQLIWKIISIDASLNSLAEKVRDDIKTTEAGAKEIVEKYTDSSNPTAWFRLDMLHRHLERIYSDYDEIVTEEESSLNRMIIKTRQIYSETINLIAEKFSDALVKESFTLDGLFTQREIFSKVVTPKLGKGKVAYFLVDALRYEMGVDLYESLDAKNKKIAFALATPPTITPVGMGALLPKAEEEFSLVDAGTPPIAPKISEWVLKIREDRVKYLEENSSVKVAVFKHDELLKISKASREKIKNSDLIVVTTQEIDSYGTKEENKELIRQIMSLVLGQIKRVIRNLGDLGVQSFVITADHGHLFGDDIGTDMRIDPPGGDTILLERRCWVGRGGFSSESYFRVKPEVFRINGDFDFAFPRNISGFKSKGGGLAFLHGGLSPQEFIIPVIEFEAEIPNAKTSDKGLGFSLIYKKEKITNRFFSVEAEFAWREILAGPETYRVGIELKADDISGRVILASYGFDESTREITLKKDEPCHITLMLPEEIKKGKISIHMLDVKTAKELARIDNMQVSIAI